MRPALALAAELEISWRFPSTTCGCTSLVARVPPS